MAKNIKPEDLNNLRRKIVSLEDRYDRNQANRISTIPFIRSKGITLHNAGLATGAKLSTNMLDSISKYAGQAGLPIEQALGIAVKESTLGNPTDNQSAKKISRVLRNYDYETEQHLNEGNSVDDISLINYYKGANSNPYADLIAKSIQNNNPSILKTGFNYANKLATKAKSGSILKEAFTDFKNNPDNYNPGQSNYKDLVKKDGEDVIKSDEVIDWWNKTGKNFYYTGDGNTKPFVENGWDKIDYVNKNNVTVNPVTGGVYTPNIQEGAVILPPVNVLGKRKVIHLDGED